MSEIRLEGPSGGHDGRAIALEMPATEEQTSEPSEEKIEAEDNSDTIQ